MNEQAIESSMTINPSVPISNKPEPITQMRLISKARLKRMVRSHGFQLGTDFYHALNDKATRLTLEAMYRMCEKGWRCRLGIEDL